MRTMEYSLSSLDRQISRFISFDHPIWSDSSDAASFLDAVDELIAFIRDLNPMAGEISVGSSLHHAEDLLHQSMFRLEDELRYVMDRGCDSFDTLHRNREFVFSSDDEGDAGDYQIPVARPVVDYDIVIEAFPSAVITDLHQIAMRMVIAGYRKELSNGYSRCRREFLEESFSRLGFQRLSVEDVQKMPWFNLTEEIDRWIKAANVALRILFPSERLLCDRVYSGFSSASDLAFMEVCRGSTTHLLSFAEAIAISSRAPERLFKILDVYETVQTLLPEFDAIFSDQYSIFLRNEAISISKRLGESVRGILMELENLTRCESSKTPIPGGGVHPMTKYITNYLLAACRSRETLEQVFEDSMLPSPQNSIPPSHLLADKMTWIMELLESNLESKSKIYGDPSISSIFMMNNGNYIVQKAKDSELGSLLGDDWIRKHHAKVRQYLGIYQRNSWSKIIGLLNSDNSKLKEKLKSFNSYFEEVCRIQMVWVVSDDELRKEATSFIVSHLSPAYRSFLGKLQGISDVRKHIKYGAEDVENRINKLFEGSNGSSSGKKRENK